MAKPTAQCPQCGQISDMSRNNRYRPFCSRRCKLIDLGDWLDETHRIADADQSAESQPWSHGNSDEQAPH